MDQQSIVQEGRGFNLTLWREILNRAARAVSSEEFQLEVINPFGFEVTMDKSFLKRNLKRFYCYVGSANKFEKPCDNLVKNFFNEFLYLLKVIDLKFASEIDIFIIESDTHFKQSLKNGSDHPARLDKSIVIEHRIFQTDLLTDYSDYLISTLWAFEARTLPELSRFDRSDSVRSRVFQLYLILEFLFGTSAGPRTKTEDEIFERIYHMRAVSLDYYFKGKSVQPASEMANNDLLVVQRRLGKIFRVVTRKSRNVMKKRVKCYNSDSFLSFSIDRELYQSIVTRIKEYYYTFQK